MIVPHEVAPPDVRELRACALAALAEAGIVYLPAHMLLTESRGLHFSIVSFAVPFVAAYVLGALAACRFRGSRHVAVAAAVAAVAIGALVGWGDVNRSVFTIAVALLVSFRVVSLGLRDWRTPLHAEFGWGAVALGLEVILASGGQPGWRPLLLLFVPLFFIGSLASRATTVWSSGGAGELDDAVRAAWIRRAALATGGLLLAMVAAVAFAVQGGVFDEIGQWLSPAVNALASFLAWGLGQAARPVLWAVDLFGIDPENVREFFERLRNGSFARRLALETRPSGPALWQRLLGLLVFVAIGYLIVRAIRLVRPPERTEPERRPQGSVEGSGLPEELPTGAGAFHSELPADTVRRAYAEVLLALRGRRIAKDPSQTPAEFAPAVATAYPSCAEAFGRLTRAYEDVRYGSLRLDAGELRRLDEGTRRILRELREAPPEGVVAPG